MTSYANQLSSARLCYKQVGYAITIEAAMTVGISWYFMYIQNTEISATVPSSTSGVSLMSSTVCQLPVCQLPVYLISHSSLRGPQAPVSPLSQFPCCPFFLFMLLLEPSKNHFFKPSVQSWSIFSFFFNSFWEPWAHFGPNFFAYF